jgi:histidine triad (HIT) family protein
MKNKSILFVCTGNRFRSLSAELAFKKYLKDHGIKNWKVGSAGTIAKRPEIDPATRAALSKLGVPDFKHQIRKVTADLLKEYDVVIALAENHLNYLQRKLGYKRALLFNDLAAHEKTSVLDIEDEVADYRTNRPAVEKKIQRTVKEIFQKTPALFQNVSERFYLFSDFVNGWKTHRNGYPFITLHETPHSVAFMSIDIPRKEDGHILVIPKQRYVDLSEIPGRVMGEIFDSIQIIGQVLNQDHGGFNLLLNNGQDAGQYIFHSHFHIIPRQSGDQIKIEQWNRQTLDVKEFVRLNKQLQKKITQVKTRSKAKSRKPKP